MHDGPAGKKIQEAKDARAAVEDQITEETLKQQQVLSDLRAKQQVPVVIAIEKSNNQMGWVKAIGWNVWSRTCLKK